MVCTTVARIKGQLSVKELRSLLWCWCWCRWLNLRGSGIWVLVIIDILCHLPHLQDVILRHTAQNPRFIRVPSEVGDLGSVPCMDELEEGKIKKYIFFCKCLLTTSSGGPSSESSVVCSSPILLKSHTWSLRSVPLDARIVSLCGDHCTCGKIRGRTMHNLGQMDTQAMIMFAKQIAVILQ